jgi:hypothetical protein
MFVESFTGVTDKLDLQLQKSSESMMVIVTGGAATNATLVSSKVIGRQGNKIMYQDVPLLDLAEMMAQDEGLYAKDLNNYVGNLPFAAARSVIMLPLAMGGAYKLGDDEYFSVDFKTLNSSFTYRVSSLESLDQDGVLWDIDKKAVPAPRQNQRWSPTKGAAFLALPITNFSQIQLFGGAGADGKGFDCTLLAEELKAKSFFDNDIVSVVARTVATTPAVNVIDTLFGFDNLILLNLTGVVEYEIFCTGTAGYSFYEVSFEDREQR